MIKSSLLLAALVVISGLATATPLTPQQASDFKQGATASCVKSVTAQTGKRFTATQIKSYCSCHAGKLASSLSLEDLQSKQVNPQDPRIVAANKACMNRLGPIKNQ